MLRLLAATFCAACTTLWAHDIITTPITFDREIKRIVDSRCASCHHPGGSAFSLLTYADARPWAEAIKEETLARRMPPWGAVKGFGDFRNDQALTQEQLELIVSWTDGGVPEGEEKDLPKPTLPLASTKPDASGASKSADGPAGRAGRARAGNAEAAAPAAATKGSLIISGEFTLKSEFKLDGLLPRKVPEKASFQITATLPDGSVQPLLWIENYKTAFGHPFLLREPLDLPPGSVIHGIPAEASIALLPVLPASAATAKATSIPGLTSTH